MNGPEAQALLKARDALLDLAGTRRPLSEMKDYPCHSLISTVDRCGRCQRQIAAWDAIDLIERVVPERWRKAKIESRVQKHEVIEACSEGVKSWIMDEDGFKKARSCANEVCKLLAAKGIM